MKPSTNPWPLKTIHGIRPRINTNPDFQRPAVWGTAQKQLLIDSILRDYDVPKLYWRKTGSRPDTYDVVDGQQRLRAVWDYFDGKFRLPKTTDPIDGSQVAGLGYEDLPDELRMKLDVYPLDIIILDGMEEDEVREMFLRLQNGTTLKAQEKRNAYPGEMRDFVKSLVQNSFFTKVGFANTRFVHDLVAAQMVCLELAGGPTNIKNADLNRMYLDHIEFDSKGTVAKAVLRNLKILDHVFPEKMPELERFNVVALYCVIAELDRQYVLSQVEGSLCEWFIQFEEHRRVQEEMQEDLADPEWVAYKEKISHSTDAEDSIRWRMEFMLRHLLERFPELPLKDNQRDFKQVQRLTVFRRDKGVCQLRIRCDGAVLAWDDWHCDHILPWSRGGQTTVANGQAACSACNLAKSNEA